MNGDIDHYEQLTESNYYTMKKMKKLFNTAFIVSFIPSGLFIIIGLIGFAVAVMTAGFLTPPILFIMIWLLCVVSFVCFSFSKSMEQNGTLASIAVIILQMLLALYVGYIPIFFLLIAGLALQIICFTKYNVIQFLKEQPGYPDFNTIFIRNMYDNRIISDSTVKQNMVNNNTDIKMDEISTDFDNKGNIL